MLQYMFDILQKYLILLYALITFTVLKVTEFKDLDNTNICAQTRGMYNNLFPI